MRDCLIILGMHRSGTSALAGAVHRLGVAVGSDIVAPQADNSRGYYEHRAVLELHEDLLAAHGSSWDDVVPRTWSENEENPWIADFRRDLSRLLADEFLDTPIWAVKDPRLSHLLPVWLPVLARLDVEPRVLIAHRPAVEVAASLAKRNHFSTEKSNALWLQHVLTAERTSRGLRRAFVDFSALLRDPTRELERAAQLLGITWPTPPRRVEEALSEFLDAKLRHAVANGSESTGLVAEVEEALATAAMGGDDAARFDELARKAEAAGGADRLVVEHLHQFARRETRSRVWAAKEPLERELARVSDRLGDGLARVEAAVEALGEARSDLAQRLEAEIEAARDHDLVTDRSVEHLAAVASSLEGAVRQHAGELDDVRQRLDRLQTEIDVEARLEELRVDLRHVSMELTAFREITRRRTFWQRLLERLAFWRSAPQPE